MAKNDDFSVPLTSGDLEEIAKTLKRWDRRLFKNGNFTELADNVSRIELMRPDDNTIIGHIVIEDGWVGFRPITA